jgi:hypothetical protein
MVARKDFPMVLRRLMAMQVPKAMVIETMVAVAIFPDWLSAHSVLNWLLAPPFVFPALGQRIEDSAACRS